MDKRKIIDKVVKLLALSENNDNENQAKAAKQKAAALMADHNISAVEATENSQYDEHRVKLNRKAPIKYDSLLTNIISKFNDVVYIQENCGPKAISLFVGRQADIEGNNYMLDVVIQQRTSQWRKYLDAYRDVYGKAPKDSIKHNWMKGFAFGVSDKLKELTVMRDECITERGLVPVSVYDQILDNYTKDHDLTTGKSRSIKYSAHGREAGRKTAIHKGVEQQTSTKLIGG